jgi:phenylpropionate dioxygenase-like ring-hydroxylating dioxygenase large terminal subunit
MRKFDAAGVEEIEIGDCKILKIEGRSIGIYYDGKKYFAIRNVCPHEQAELCKGKITGTTLPSKPHEYIYGMEGVLREREDPGIGVRRPLSSMRKPVMLDAKLFAALPTLAT